MKTTLKQASCITGIALIIYFIFTLFFLITGIQNPALKYIIGIPVSVFIAFILFTNREKK